MLGRPSQDIPARSVPEAETAGPRAPGQGQEGGIPGENRIQADFHKDLQSG